MQLKKEELKELNSQTLFYLDTQHLDDALFNLVNGELSSFKLVLNQKRNIYFEFEIAELNILNIIAPSPVFIDSNWQVNQYINDLKHLGFKTNENNKIIYNFDITHFKDAIAIKKFLARVLYEHYFVAIDNPAIEF